MRQVVITGIGLVTSIGLGREATWRALKAGKSGATRLDDGHAGFPVRWPEPPNIDPALAILDLAANEAMTDAGLLPGTIDRDRAAVLIGLSKGGVHSLGHVHELIREQGDEAEIARLWLDSWPNSGASRVANRFDLRGPCEAPIAACATGLIAVLDAADLIRRGACDVALAGAADASIEPMILAAFRRMKVLADVGDDPKTAVRPWDRARSGFLVGEGGAVVVLEAADHADRRGASSYARVIGGASGSLAAGMTALGTDPSDLARLIGRAIDSSGLTPADLDHVNVHGTATRSNDPYECRSLRMALGADADRVACSANKGQIGHLLGASGAVELAITALSVRDGFVPPTLNLDNPECDLDGTPRVGVERPIRSALKLSIGFGGHIAAAVLSKI